MKNKALKIVFMGTSQFAVPSLETLAGSPHQLMGVVSQPDRPRGRGRRLQPTPVKEAALRYGIPVLQFERIRDEQAVQGVKELVPDLIVVVSYGQILPADLLQAPPWGCINVHASLLPDYRGGGPHPAGHHGRPDYNWSNYHAYGCGNGYGRYTAAGRSAYIR
jgi:methionyl-tRNA formyltransferase (EC 2.1.2.9)